MTIGAQSYLDSNVESATDSTKAIQKAESDNDNGVESVELPTRSEVESRPNVDAILSSLNHVNPTNPIAKSTILGHTSKFSTQVAPTASISGQGYSNTVPEWLLDDLLEVDTTKPNIHHDVHYKPDPAGVLLQDIKHVDTTECPPDPHAPRSLPNQTTAEHGWCTNCSKSKSKHDHDDHDFDACNKAWFVKPSRPSRPNKSNKKKRKN